MIFHLDALTDWTMRISKWKNSAIKADMATGDEKESGFYDKYYDPEDESDCFEIKKLLDVGV